MKRNEFLAPQLSDHLHGIGEIYHFMYPVPRFPSPTRVALW